MTPQSSSSSPSQTSQNPTDSAWHADPSDPWEALRSFISETPADFSSGHGNPDEWTPPREWNAHAPPRVLLAHADETRREGLAWELGACGCTVVEVEDGKELLDYLDEGGAFPALPRPDVIVAELDMPGCGGLEAAKALRARGDQTPIVFINVASSPSSAIAAARLYKTRLLDGEIEGGVLRAAVDTALRDHAP